MSSVDKEGGKLVHNPLLLVHTRVQFRQRGKYEGICNSVIVFNNNMYVVNNMYVSACMLKSVMISRQAALQIDYCTTRAYRISFLEQKSAYSEIIERTGL